MTAAWVENARTAKLLLVGKRHGAREMALLEAGWKDANTARRAIAALDFLDFLKRSHAKEYRALGDAPSSILELLARGTSSTRR
jgi:hypothetical protein